MKRYLIRCQVCTASEVHGSQPPANPNACNTARSMRGACREKVVCKFETKDEDFEPDAVDLLRLGMREERAIA